MALYVKRNDTEPLEAILLGGTGNKLKPFDLTGASSVTFRMEQIDGTKSVTGACVIVDADAGEVRYNWAAGNTDTAGGYRVEFEVVWPGGRSRTFPNKGYGELFVVADLG